jgi:phosphatidylglycerophosphate synthase
MVLAAGRAGYGRIFFLARDQAAPPGTTAIPDWRRLAEILGSSQVAPLVVAPQTIVAERNWLETLRATNIEPATWAARSGRIIVIAAAAVPDALTALDAGDTDTIRAVEEGLTQRLEAAAALPIAIDPLVIEASKDIPIAERRLLRGLVKETDGFMARHFDRAISLWISRRLASTAIKPTQVTMISMAIGLCGAPFFLSAAWSWQTLGALLFLAHSIVDGCDGELARLKFQETRYGGILDFWGDNVVHVAVFGCIAAGWAMAAAATWPLLLGGAAISGTLGSAAFVHWRQMRPRKGSGPLFTSVSNSPETPLARLLDAGSRRDFIYLVPVLALLGKSSWFLALAALGAPIFFVLLLVLAARERLQSRSRYSASSVR